MLPPDYSIDFLHDSFHPDNQSDFEYKVIKAWVENSNWHELNIIGTKADRSSDKTDTVNFITKFSDRSCIEKKHYESLQFKRVNKHLLVL